MEITEFRFNSLFPKFVLRKEEAEVIVAVIQEVMKEQEIIRRGSFMLYGAFRGHEQEPKEIIAANFGDGREQRCARFVLEEVLFWGNDRVTGIVESPCNCCEDYLIIRTAYGCFTSVLCTTTKTAANKRAAVYAALALTLTYLRQRDDVDDWTLNFGVNRMLDDVQEDNPDIEKVRKLVTTMFEEEEIPEIKAWSEWHDQNNPGLYFE